MAPRLDPFIRTDLLRRLPSPERRTEIRALLCLSLQDVATMAHVTPQAVRLWEHGATPQDRNLADYVDALEAIVAKAADAPPHDPNEAA